MASEFAQEFSTVLKGMEKERIAREKKTEDALILRETKREADLSKAEIKQQEQAEKDSARQKEINNTLKKFLTKDGKYRKNLSADNQKIISTLENEQSQMELDRQVAEQNIAKLRVEEKAATDYRSADVKAIEESKLALEEMRKRIEGQGGKAEENKEFNKASLEIQQREFDLRLKNASSPSAREEIEKERRAAIDKQGTFLEKISAGIMGMRSSMRDSAKAALKSAGKGIFAVLKGTLFAGLLFAFANFLKSPMFGEMIDFLDNTLTPIVKGFYNNFLKPVGVFLKENLGEFFKDLANFAKDPSLENLKKFDLTPTLTAIGVITALLAPGLLLKGLKGSVGLLTKAFSAVTSRLTNTASNLPVPGGGQQSGGGPNRGGQPGRVTRMARGIQTMGMSAGKGIGGFIGGILKGIASGLAAIANPLTLVGLAAVVLAINGIAAAIRIASPAFEPIGQLMKDFGASVKEVFGGIGTFVKDVGKTIEGIILSIGESIGNVIDKITNMKTAGTDATTKQIKALSDIPSDNLFSAAKGIDAMKKALNDFGGGTFSKVADKLFGGDGPIDKLVALTEKVPALMKAAEAISVISAAGGDYAIAQQELKRRERVVELESQLASGDVEGRNTKENIAKAQAELDALKAQKMELKISGNRQRGGPMSSGEAYIVGETGKELVIPKTDSMVLNENKTDTIINAALNKSTSKTAPAPLVISSTNTNAPVNHNSTNVASNTFVEPNPMFRRTSQFAI